MNQGQSNIQLVVASCFGLLGIEIKGSRDKELLAFFASNENPHCAEVRGSFWKMADASGRVLHVAKSHTLKFSPGRLAPQNMSCSAGPGSAQQFVQAVQRRTREPGVPPVVVNSGNLSGPCVSAGWRGKCSQMRKVGGGWKSAKRIYSTK